MIEGFNGTQNPFLPRNFFRAPTSTCATPTAADRQTQTRLLKGISALLIPPRYLMGIKGGLLKKLPGGRRSGYQHGLVNAHLNGVPVNLDAAGLLFACAR
jgi:hypothetical protein